MKKIILVTGNQGKLIYARGVLRDFKIKVIQRELEINEGRSHDPKKIVKEKALQAYEQIKGPLLIEDSGIFIEELGGFPKTMIHFAEETVGIEGILKLMQGVENRAAEFRSALAFISAEYLEPIIFEEVDGGFTIAKKVWETTGLILGEFDRILIPPGEIRTNSVLSQQERVIRQKVRKKQTHWYKFGKWYSGRLKK